MPPLNTNKFPVPLVPTVFFFFSGQNNFFFFFLPDIHQSNPVGIQLATLMTQRKRKKEGYVLGG
jgi:hypothetical protein